MAHPVRLEILLKLAEGGPATATELAKQMDDQSPANCSWHLRQLAQYGFITEAESGPGRQRRWRVVAESTYVATDDSPEMIAASNAFDDVLLEGQLAVLRRWFATRRHESPEWRQASFVSHSVAWLTAAEMAEVKRAVGELFERMLYPLIAERFNNPETRPPGSRPARLVNWLIPSGPEIPDDAPPGAEPSDPRSNDDLETAE